MHCVDTSPKLDYKQTQILFVSEHAAKLLSCIRSAQLMLCSETCPKTKMKMLLLTAIAVRSFSVDVKLEINSCQVSAS